MSTGIVWPGVSKPPRDGVSGVMRGADEPDIEARLEFPRDL